MVQASASAFEPPVLADRGLGQRAAGADGEERQRAQGLALVGDGRLEDRARDHALREVVAARKIRLPVGHGKPAAAEVRFQHRSWNDATQKVVAALGPKPGMRQAARHAVRLGQFALQFLH